MNSKRSSQPLNINEIRFIAIVLNSHSKEFLEFIVQKALNDFN